MIRETYKGRKILVTKGKHWGYSEVKVNGVSVSTHLGTQESALSNIRANIDYIGDEIDGARWSAEWYAKGTFEMCDNGHPRRIGGTCTHPYCVDEMCSHCGTPKKDHCAICSLCRWFCNDKAEELAPAEDPTEDIVSKDTPAPDDSDTESTNTDDTGHVDVKCTNPECYGCNFCAGGLWACSVCGGFEGSMPSICPREQMDESTIDAVYAGLRDFRAGAWVEYEFSRFAPHSAQRKACQL